MARIKIKVPDWLDRICAWPAVVYRKSKYGYSFRRIYLDEGKWTIVDEQDYYRYGQYKWNVEGTNGKFYAIRGAQISPKEIKLVMLHREIMNAPKGLLVDHKNNDSLDNRRSNLRLATKSQNNVNRPKKANTSSRFIGVFYERRRGIYSVKISCNRKVIRLGRFKDEIAAAKAYDEAAKKYHGEFARLNFP